MYGVKSMIHLSTNIYIYTHFSKNTSTAINMLTRKETNQTEKQGEANK